MVESKPLRGVIPYLVSPLDDAGGVRREVLARLCEDLIAAGVHGLAPLGSTGEFAYLSDAQRLAVAEVVVHVAERRVPVLAAVASTTTAGAVAQARSLHGLGCDALIVTLESYFPLSDDEVVSYFTAVAEATPLPVVLYTNPNFQRTDLSLNAIERLSRLETVRYLKDASFNTGRLLSIMNRTEGRLEVFSASSHIPAAVMLLGGVGWMAGPACLLPRESLALYEACRRGDWQKAMALQRKLWAINQLFNARNLAAMVKAGLTLKGYDVGDPIPPQRPLGPSAVAELRETFGRFAGT